MTFGSLFAGVGGIDLGLERAGLACRFQVEIDPFCRKVLEKHWPEVPKFSDVRKCYGTNDLDGSVKTAYPVLDWGDRMRGKLRKLTPEDVVSAVEMYEKGLALQPIADHFQVSRQAMWDLLRRRTAMRSQKRYGEENHFHRGGKTAEDRAQNLVDEAVKRGLVIRKSTCEKCGESPIFKDGRSGIQAHHCDYSKPLEVMWLCQKCHHEWHKNNRATPKEVRKELPPVTVLCGGFP